MKWLRDDPVFAAAIAAVTCLYLGAIGIGVGIGWTLWGQ